MKHRILAVSAFSLLCAQHLLAQNVGIGTATPTQPLEVRSAGVAHLLKLDGPLGMFVSLHENGLYRGYLGSFAGNAEDVDFGTGAGNTNGKLHLTIRANPRLTIDDAGNVGIGTTSPQWRLDVNGSMQLLGRLFVSGSSGVAGQVLTSNGLSAPSWQTLSGAFDNNVRFSLSASNPTLAAGELTFSTRYNTSPSSVVVSGTTLTFNTTGIYHFDIAISGRIDYSSPLGFNPRFGLNFFVVGGVGAGNNTVGDIALLRRGTSNSYSGTVIQGFDMYITAGQSLEMSFGYSDGTGTITEIDTFGYIRGYLIN